MCSCEEIPTPNLDSGEHAGSMIRRETRNGSRSFIFMASCRSIASGLTATYGHDYHPCAVRILIFSDYYWPEPSPPAHHIHERARLWVQDGHDVTVVASAPNYPEGRLYDGFRNRWREKSTHEGVSIVRVGTWICGHDRAALKLLDQLSFGISAGQFRPEQRPDVIFSSSPHLFTSTSAKRVSKRCRCPHVMEVRDLWPDSVLRAGSMPWRILKRVERGLYRSARSVIVMSPAFQASVERDGARDVHIVPGGTDLDLFKPMQPDSSLIRELDLEGMFVVGYPGTLGTAHDVDVIVRAVPLLRGSRVRLLLVGGGPHLDRLHERIPREDRGLVRFLGTQPRSEMPRVWSVLDASMVLLRDTPDFARVIPSKIFESMACGKPVLWSGPQGTGSELIERHGAGVWCGCGNADQLAASMLNLSSDLDETARLGAAGVAAAPQYSRQQQAESTLAVLTAAAEMES
jgi:colanic acid biosynthesis glycosyl transferase WcaI